MTKIIKEDITNLNSKGQHNGYQEWYNHGEMIHRGNWKNNRVIGYAEWYRFNETFFYII